jgi:hypothetical protein
MRHFSAGAESGHLEVDAETGSSRCGWMLWAFFSRAELEASNDLTLEKLRNTFERNLINSYGRACPISAIGLQSSSTTHHPDAI